jgi:hemoglobin/transferrin/lactoferrin receptor protein
MKKILLGSAALTALSIVPAKAQESADQPVVLAQITVTASRIAQPVEEAPATVSVITAEEIEDDLASDVKDLIRFEPGVSVRAAPSRFTAAGSSTGRDGNSGFNIRGLEGNRVLIQTDGIRLPDSYSFGAQAVGRGDYLDLDILKSVEILRGAASALYGSDGLAGAVSFITKDPDDIVAKDKTFAGRARVAYASADESWTEGVTAAGTWDSWQTMLVYSRRDGHEQETQGENNALNTTRTTANPQDFESNSVLGKIVFAPSEANRFRLTYEHYDRDVTTEVYTARAVPPPALTATSTLDLDALDETERDRISLDHRYESEGGLIDRASWALYYQTSTTRQWADEDRNISADRIRDTTFDNEIWGATGQVQRSFELGGSEHLILFGGDYSTTRQEGIRSGTVPPAGETFPTRAFPNTDYALAGLFLQDEIKLLDEKLVLYPALRYDYYDLSPESDALYLLPTASQSDSRVSPKFGAVFWPVHQFGLFANYAAGFKAPAPSQVNNGFANPISNYISLANPNLEPETSDSIEFGVRWRDVDVAGAKLSGQVTGFDADYENFIEQVQVSGTFTPTDPAIYQFVNLSKVSISGAEARVDAVWANGFGFTAAAAYAKGDQTTAGVSTPLLSIDPWKLVAGLTYRDPDGHFGGQFIVTHSDGKDPGRTAPGLFTPDGFTILDITAYVNLTDAATLRIGAFNVTDEKYWWWGDVRGLSTASLVRDSYTQPGANFSAALSYRF